MSDKERKEKLWDADMATLFDIEQKMGEISVAFIMRKFKVSTTYAIEMKKASNALNFSRMTEDRPSA